MVCLTREQILAAPVELERAPVTIKEWGGGPYYVRELTGFERDEWEAAIMADRVRARAITVVRTLVNEAGERVFTDADVDPLRAKSGRLIARLSEKARKLNRLGDEDVEEVRGNSGPDRSDGSASA